MLDIVAKLIAQKVVKDTITRSSTNRAQNKLLLRLQNWRKSHGTEELKDIIGDVTTARRGSIELTADFGRYFSIPRVLQVNYYLFFDYSKFVNHDLPYTISEFEKLSSYAVVGDYEKAAIASLIIMFLRKEGHKSTDFAFILEHITRKKLIWDLYQEEIQEMYDNYLKSTPGDNE